MNGERRTTNDRHLAPNETPVQRHFRELREWRYNAIVATIPAAIPRRLRAEYMCYADRATRMLGRRSLARVHWPWNDRVQTGRVARGRTR